MTTRPARLGWARAATGTLLLGVVCGACTATPTPPPAVPPPAPTSASASSGVPGATVAPRPSAAVTGTPIPSAPTVPAGRPGQPRGAVPAPVSSGDPDAVAAAFADTTFTYDTAIDRSPFDAQVRSAVYATAQFATQLRRPLVQGGGAEWTALAAHHGYTTVALTPNVDDGRPPDQLRAAARSFTPAVTGHGDGGWVQLWDSQTMYVFLTRTGAQALWQVDRVSFGSAQ